LEPCEEHAIEVEWVEPPKKAWAVRRARKIRVHPVINQKRYVTALHEIGHIVGRRQSRTRIEGEWGAWEFALASSRVTLTPATHAKVFRCLNGYVERYRHWKGAYLPPDSHPFWHFMRDLEARSSAKTREGKRTRRQVS
jgi:hypothetical protein